MNTIITDESEILEILHRNENLVDSKQIHLKSYYHFTSLDSFLKIWATQKLLLCSRKKMNDSAEREEVASGIREYADFLSYWYAIDEYKQLSLCYNTKQEMYLSPVMWGIYAKNSKGVCIELNPDKLSIEKDTYIADIVEYTDDIPNCPRLPYGEPFRSINDAVKFVEENMHDIFFRKYKEWDFESEYRVISKKSLYLDISGAISMVYIFNMDEADYEILTDFNRMVPVEQKLEFKCIQYRSDKNNTKKLKCYVASEEYAFLKGSKTDFVKLGEEQFERMLKDYKKIDRR